jgi:23S rRNA pseudouridine2605 synthase
MRINKFVAAATGMSRRTADMVIAEHRVLVDGKPPTPGQDVQDTQAVTLDGSLLSIKAVQTILVHKPRGYVTSREGQGAQTIYALIPPQLHHLKPVGRLDKDTSGLLLMTNDGALAQQLTHPSNHKVKMYEATLSKPLAPLHRQMIAEMGIQLEDGPSRLDLERLHDGDDRHWRIMMHEGRNRQIRRTFESLGYAVTALHRTQFGPYVLGSIPPGKYQTL